MTVSFKTHRLGRHLLVFGDGGADHCRRCGEFHGRGYAVNPDDCDKVPKAGRWWPQKPPEEESEQALNSKDGVAQ